jgi:hypothetical protein
MRPIVEANILSKYGPIKLFVDELRSRMIPQMNSNQFSFPGKGTPLAIHNILDEANSKACNKFSTAIVLFDFSNAFNTFSHDALSNILKHYNIPESLKTLTDKFLKQSNTIIKMSDKDGFYFSDKITTNSGSPQGQIGSDFLFAIINDSIDVITPSDNVKVKQIKYVDDLSHIYSAKTTQDIIKTILFNQNNLLQKSNSIGLKLNEEKTKIIPIRCDNNLLKQKFKIEHETKLLGFSFSVRDRMYDQKLISGNNNADNIIKRLNASATGGSDKRGCVFIFVITLSK